MFKYLSLLALPKPHGAEDKARTEEDPFRMAEESEEPDGQAASHHRRLSELRMIDPFTSGPHYLSGCGGHESADDSNEITMNGNLELGDGEIGLVIVER